MKFYRLTYPDYKTDQADSRANPIEKVLTPYIPGIICSVCHETWAGSRSTYLPVPGDVPIELLSGGPILESQWLDLAERVRRSLQLTPDYPLMPGDCFGVPRYRFRQSDVHDILHGVNGFIIKHTIAAQMAASGLSGFELLRVSSEWGTANVDQSSLTPEFFALRVTGAAWRSRVDLKMITICEHCGRTGFPDPTNIVVDLRRWDGSDVFHLDRNPNMIFVTERMCDLLSDCRATNWRSIESLSIK